MKKTKQVVIYLLRSIAVVILILSTFHLVNIFVPSVAYLVQIKSGNVYFIGCLLIVIIYGIIILFWKDDIFQRLSVFTFFVWMFLWWMLFGSSTVSEWVSCLIINIIATAYLIVLLFNNKSFVLRFIIGLQYVFLIGLVSIFMILAIQEPIQSIVKEIPSPSGKYTARIEAIYEGTEKYNITVEIFTGSSIDCGLIVLIPRGTQIYFNNYEITYFAWENDNEIFIGSQKYVRVSGTNQFEHSVENKELFNVQ